MKYFLLSLIIFSFSFSEKLPNDVRWVVKSKEYKSLCNQTYNIAEMQLDAILKKKKRTGKLAVVMDLDETVLDNSLYQIELNQKNESFNMKSWAKWVLREEAQLVPGAKRYIKKLRKNDIQIIFISNRMHERLKATKSNMKKLDIFSKDDIYLLRKNKEDKKTVRRNEIYSSTGRMKKYKKFNVIQYFGDAIGDFPNLEYSEFGTSQFIFPNPMYGKW